MRLRLAFRYLRQLSIAAGVVCLATSAGLSGQSAAPQEPSRPSFRTEANYVRVDVSATTRDGVPVGDLRRDEFQLLEDRVPQAIDLRDVREERKAVITVSATDGASSDRTKA